MPAPIYNYDSLQSAIADFLNRQDLSTKVPTFISLAEAKFQRQMRCWQMVNRQYAQVMVNPATGTLSEYLPLPADYLEMKRASIQNAPCPAATLTYAPMSEIDYLQQQNVQGNTPTSYAIVGGALRLGPYPDKQYQVEITYYAKLPKLTEQNQTNWLLADHPDFYLYASLLQAAPYLKDDERIAVWQGIVGDAEGPNGGSGILGDIKTANERMPFVEVRLMQEAAVCFTSTMSFIVLDQTGAEKMLGGPLPEAWKRYFR